MAGQIKVRTRDEDLQAGQATGLGMAGAVQDLHEELSVICAYASRGGEVSYDAELTESYFARIETAGKKAEHISQQLLLLDATRRADDGHTKAVAWPTALPPGRTTSDPPPSSFRRRLRLK